MKNDMNMNANTDPDPWHIGEVALRSRFLLGTAGYPSPDVLGRAIEESGSEVVTVGLKRQLARPADTQRDGAAPAGANAYVDMIRSVITKTGARLLPNTAGCRSAHEAVQLACMARELYDTPWIKLEVVGDEYTLQPDTHELVVAASQLVRDGFTVLPYCTDDLIVGRRLLDAGCAVLMPWAAPIGSGQGIVNPVGLRILRERLPDATLIVDAGIGAPSHAALALEMGFDAVLLNSAVAQAVDPVCMARAFRHAIQAGRDARLAGVMVPQDFATASTPVGGHAFILGSAS
ncbi:thiazole synthase [soil metagenome]